MYTPRQRLVRLLRTFAIALATGIFALVVLFPYLEVCKQRSAVARQARSLKRFLQQRQEVVTELRNLAEETLPKGIVSLALNHKPGQLPESGLHDPQYWETARQQHHFLCTLFSEAESPDTPAIETLETELAWQALREHRDFKRAQAFEDRLEQYIYATRNSYNRARNNLQTARAAYEISPIGRFFPLADEADDLPPLLPPVQVPVLDFASILTPSQRSLARHEGARLKLPIVLMTINRLPPRMTRKTFPHNVWLDWQKGYTTAPAPIVILLIRNPAHVEIAYAPTRFGLIPQGHQRNIRQIATRALQLDRFDEAIPFIYHELQRALAGYPPSNIHNLSLRQIQERELTRFLSEQLVIPSYGFRIDLPIITRQNYIRR